MLTVLSPAKSLDFTPQKQVSKSTVPGFLDEAEILVKRLRRISRRALGELMGISDDLSQLNHQRYQEWTRPFTTHNAKQAILAFNGEVYAGFDAKSLRTRDFAFAQNHLRILSGLYGALRPLDLIQPYRLEMGTKLTTRGKKTLYDFWGEKITNSLNETLADHRQCILVNLASNEYFKSVTPRLLTGQVITPIFREIKGGKSRILATFAKKARGRMAAWIIRHRIENPEKLAGFGEDGYGFVADESTESELVFARPQPPPVGTNSLRR